VPCRGFDLGHGVLGDHRGCYCGSRAVSDPHGSRLSPWACVGVALVRLRGFGDDVHGHDGDLVDRHTVAGIGRGGYVSPAIGAAFLASVASSVIRGTAHAVAEVATGAAAGASQAAGQAATRGAGDSADPTAYFVDSPYRTDQPGANAAAGDLRAESRRILVNGMRSGGVPAPDKIYLAQLVSARTGLSQADAEKRVDAVIVQENAAEVRAAQAADAARKAASYLSIFMALSMLVGAFIACAAAALGGQQRDVY
jgi:hypothetical protein